MKMAFGAQRQLRRTGSRIHEQVSLGIRRDAGCFADIHIVGKPFQHVGRRFIRYLTNLKLRAEGVPDPQDERQQQTKLQRATHGYLLIAYLVFDVRGAPAAPSVNFCARQATISPTSISFSFLQSMSWTVESSPSPFPAFPNLPTTVPSSSILKISPVTALTAATF